MNCLNKKREIETWQSLLVDDSAYFGINSRDLGHIHVHGSAAVLLASNDFDCREGHKNMIHNVTENVRSRCTTPVGDVVVKNPPTQ